MRAEPKKMIETLCRVFKRLHYPVEIILVCVRWYVAYPLCLRHLEEMMAERGVVVDRIEVARGVNGISVGGDPGGDACAAARGRRRREQPGVASQRRGRVHHRCQH